MRHFAVLFIAFSIALAAFALQQPVGIYHLYGAGDVVCTDPAWTNANVDGVRLRLAWSDYEPSEGVYLWDTDPGDCSNGGNDLDSALKQANDHNKFIGLSIAAGGACPDWIFGAPVSSGSVYPFFVDPSDPADSGKAYMPLIWDTVFQAKYGTFMNALSAHLAASPYGWRVLYVVMAGVSKGIDMRQWCQNFDATVAGIPATVTHVVSGGIDYTQVVAPTANFLTRSNPNNVAPFNGVVGLAITDGPVKLRGGQVVCSQSAPGNDPNCPADPTNSTVYVTKADFSDGSTTVQIEQWLIGLGEFYQMDQAAKSPPGGYPGLHANANGMDDTHGPRTGSYVQAVETIIGQWFGAFPSSNLVLTWSAPYRTSQGQTDAQTIQTDMQATYAPNYGEMVISLQSACPPHDWGAQVCMSGCGNGGCPGKHYSCFDSPPHPVQAIYATSNPAVYGNDPCNFKGPSALQDMIDNMFDRGEKSGEIYTIDCATIDPSTGDPGLAAMASLERSRFHFYNLQSQQRAHVSLKPL